MTVEHEWTNTSLKKFFIDFSDQRDTQYNYRLISNDVFLYASRPCNMYTFIWRTQIEKTVNARK